MSVKSRNELKGIFDKGLIPTASDFKDLIDSAVNKRDDRFFGKWVCGDRYCNGDVVLYGKSLYMLNLPQPESCEGETEIIEQCICSKEPPVPDNDMWCLLELEINDEDWEVLPATDDRDYDIMYAKVYGRIGMGTKNPDARVDITGEGKGKFLFDPDGKQHPTAEIHNLSNACDANYLWNQLAESANWITDAPMGFQFKVFNKMAGDKVPTDESETHLLMLIAADDKKKPCVGIGTDAPEATLDVKNDNGQVLVKTDAVEGPEIILVSLDTKEDDVFFSLSVDDAWAALTTDSAKGFQLRRSEAYNQHKKGVAATALVTVTERGEVGIGTEEPNAQLQVTDAQSGSFSMNLNQPSPSLSIVNLRPKAAISYLTMGADNDQSAFITDANEGFVFKRGEAASEGNEERLDQGKDLVRIQPDGKVGVGKVPHEKDYLLDVNGDSRTFGLYQVADADKMKSKPKKYPTDDLMDNICSLSAYVFNWDDAKNECATTEQQLGLKPSEVEEYFGQVVRGRPGEKAIAYQNLVPVLIEAVKNLHARVLELEGRNNDD